MTGFFKKKRQSTLSKKQQQQHLLNGQDGETPRNTSSSSSQRSHTQINPSSSPTLNMNSQKLQFASQPSPQNNHFPYSPNKGQSNYQYSNNAQTGYNSSQQQHYSTANIPPQSTFQNVSYQQQPQLYSKSATPGPISQFSSPQIENSTQVYGQQQQQQHLPQFRQQQQHYGSPKENPQYYQQHFQQHQQRQPQTPPQQQQQQQQQQHQNYPQSHHTPRDVRSYSSNSRQTDVIDNPVQKESLPRASIGIPPLNLVADHRIGSTPQSIVSRVQSKTPWKRKRLFNSPFPRYRHTASSITADNGCLFVMGGLRDDNVYGDIWVVAPVGSETSAEYSYIAKPIETTDGVPAPRVCHNSILIGNAFIVYGGDTIKLNLDGELDNNLYFFNINSMKWTTPSPNGRKPSGRYGHTITVVTFQNNNENEVSSWSSYLYLFGGQLDDEKFNDMWCFDLSNFRRPTTQWRKIYSNDISSQYQPPPLSNHTMTVYDGRIFIYGGSTIGGELSNALYCFNPVDESWSACPYTSLYQLPAVEEHSSVLYQNFLISYGGKDAHGSTISEFTVIDLDTFQVYRVETPLSGSPGRRAGHSLTYCMKDEKLLVMGGDQLNLESINSSRDDVVFDGLLTDESNDDFLLSTSVDHLLLEYDTTYVYEFDLELLESFLIRNPDPNYHQNITSHVSSLRKPILSSGSLSKSKDIESTPYREEPPKPSSPDNVDLLDDREVASSTPLKSDADASNTINDTSAGSINLARKVSISSHANNRSSGTHNGTSSVKRIDSINVHKNRRIKSAGSFNDDKVEIVNSSKNVTPVLKQILSTDSKDFNGPPSEVSHDDFRTPLSSYTSIPQHQDFRPYQKVGSKVELQMDSDEEVDDNHVETRFSKIDNAYNNNLQDSNEKIINGTGGSGEAFSSTSSFPNSKNKKVNIPSAISDTTMNSFLDNYTNKAGSYDQYSSKEQIHNISSSSIAYSSSEDLHKDEETPLVTNTGQFEPTVSNELSTPPSSNFGSQYGTTITSPENDASVKPEVPFVTRSVSDSLAKDSARSTSQKSKNPFDAENLAIGQDDANRERLESSGNEKSTEMAGLYERLNDLKKSLNEKMIIANEKIVGLEQLSQKQKQESESLRVQLLEKDAIIESLSQNHSLIINEQLLKVENLNGLVTTHQKSIDANNSLLQDLRNQIEAKDREILDWRSTHAENKSKLDQYEILLNDRMLNLNKFNKVLQKQKEFVQQQQMKHIQKEELMLKRINELTLENENMKVECDKYKRMHDITNNNELDDDEILQDSNGRNVSGAFRNRDADTASDEDDFNDTSISELSHGLDKLISTIRSVSGGNQ